MNGRTGRHDGGSLAAQDADTNEIADRPLDCIGGGEVLALVDLTCQVTDRELRWMLCQHEIENGALGTGIIAVIGR